MSIRIARDLLSKEQKEKIFVDLTFRPKLSYVAQSAGTTAPDPIMFYVVDKEYVYLPFKYGEKLLGPQAVRDYPLAGFRYTGTLLPRQPSVVEEAMQQLDQHGTTLLHLYTGFGKTVVASYLAATSRMKTCVLMNSTPLLPQWKSTFEQMTDAKVWIVGEKMIHPDPDVILLMSGRLEQVPAELREKIGLLIIDECHKFCTPTSVAPILAFTPKFIIACSATPTRSSDNLHHMIYALIGTHEVFRPLDKKFTVVCFRTGICPELKQNKMGSMDWASAVKDLCGDETRNQLIVQWVLANLQLKQLILTWNADHAFFLQKYLTGHGVKAAVMARNLKTYSDSQVLIGTIAKIGTGFDEKAACADFGGERISMLLLVGSTKNVELLTQVTGRAFRADNPYIVDFVDDVPCIKGTHWTARRKWYEQQQANIEEVCAPGAKPGRKTRSRAKIQEPQSSQSLTEAHLASVLARYGS